MLPSRDHVIVVGLGALGARIVDALRKRRIPVVAIECREDAPGVNQLRSRGVQILIGDTGDTSLLELADALTARSLVVTLGSDLDSLRVVLAATQETGGGHEGTVSRA
jgi:voltage-gated potassium channel Kch